MSRSEGITQNAAAARAAEIAAERARQERIQAEQQRRAAEAAREVAQQAAQKNKLKEEQARSRDGFDGQKKKSPVNLDGADRTSSARNASTGEGAKLPKDPKDLPKLFPELKGNSDAQLRKVHASMTKVVTGTLPEKLTGLGELSKTFPQSTPRMLEKLGLKDSKVAKLATNAEALGALGKLADPKTSTADRVSASLTLASTAGTVLRPADLKGFLAKSLDGLKGADKLTSAIITWADPSKSGLDKAKATLTLASTVRELTGSNFPALASDLRKLDGSFRALNAAFTLMDSKASFLDRTLAAAQLAAEIPDLGKDLVAFKNALQQFGVKDAAKVAEEGAQLAVKNTVKGLSSALASELGSKGVYQLGKLARKVDPETLEKVLKNVSDPKALRGLMEQLSSLDADAGKRLLTQVAGMEKRVLTESLSNPTMAKSLATLATKLDDQTAAIIGKVAKDIDAGGLRALLKFADAAPPDALKLGLKALGPGIEKAGGKLVGQGLKLLDGMLSKMGVRVTAEVAGKTLKNLAKVIPLAGALPGMIDAVKFGKEAAQLRDKNKDLGFFALVGANLNATDAVVGTVLDFTGVGVAVDVGVGLGFAAAELALDLAFESEKKKLEADPKNYQAPDWMKAVNLAGAAAMGPPGMTQLASYYGPKGAADLVGWGVDMGAKGAKELASWAGGALADLANGAFNAAKDATDGELSIAGRKVDLNPLW